MSKLPLFPVVRFPVWFLAPVLASAASAGIPPNDEVTIACRVHGSIGRIGKAQELLKGDFVFTPAKVPDSPSEAGSGCTPQSLTSPTFTDRVGFTSLVIVATHCGNDRDPKGAQPFIDVTLTLGSAKLSATTSLKNLGAKEFGMNFTYARDGGAPVVTPKGRFESVSVTCERR